MPNLPIPTEILKLRGTGRRHRLAKREGELHLPGNFPQPPVGLPAAAMAEWERIRQESKYAGVLTGADRQVMVIYCSLAAEFNAGACGLAEPMKSARIAQLRAVCSELGLTPPSRTKIMLPVGKKTNPFAEL